jgi:hypothetical protein
LTKISGADLNVFDFDYDLNWYAFFLSPAEKVYGRYGGRDAKSPDGRLSLAGLRYALSRAREAHRRDSGEATPPRESKTPLLVDDYPAAKRLRPGTCIHCHQVNEFRRAQQKAAGTWRRDDVWVYPLPENVGLTLDVDQGDLVRAVAPDSAAARAGVRAGDVLRRLDERPVASLADVQYALHRAPGKGAVPVVWSREGKPHEARLELAEGWRKTNVTWRPSLLDVLPSLSLFGDDLTPEEKKKLGLPAKRLAFRQEERVAKDAREAGVKSGDVIVGVDGLALELEMLDFLAYVRRNYLAGDRITLNVLRDGKPIDLPMTLR